VRELRDNSLAASRTDGVRSGAEAPPTFEAVTIPTFEAVTPPTFEAVTTRKESRHVRVGDARRRADATPDRLP
jgi:hypothetical protein